jgi:polyisoprenoid-binding protein YceI
MSSEVEAITKSIAGSWAIQPTDTRVTVTATKLGFISVVAKLELISGTISVVDGHVTIDMRLDPASVDTGNAKRDAHLRGADFLDTSTYPQASFTATQPWHGESGPVKGVLTVRDKAVNVTLHVDNLAVDGVQRIASFSVTGNVNRDDLGLTKAPGFIIKKQLQLDVSAHARQARS